MTVRPRRTLAQDVHTPERRHFLKRLVGLVAGGALFAGVKQAWAEPQAPQGTAPYIGEIMLTSWAAGVAPAGWMECNGQVIPVTGNENLFSLIGTVYGGNGVTDFALPDLRGRVPMHKGQGTGLTNRPIGQQGGSETVQLTTAELPAHSHGASGSTDVGTVVDPTGAYPARSAAGTPLYAPTSNTATGGGASEGSDQGHQNMPPYLVLRYWIATSGSYPLAQQPTQR